MTTEKRYERLGDDELAMSPPELLRHVRTIVDGANFGEDLPLAWLSEALERLEELTAPPVPHGDGDCPPNCELPGPHSLGTWPFGGVQVGDVPDAPAVRRTLDWDVPYEDGPPNVMPSQDGIRGHRILTGEEAEAARALLDSTRLITRATFLELEPPTGPAAS